MGQDLRFAIRTLRKNPAFTVIAVCALALGIGANTAIFTVVDRVLLRPLPYENADRLVNIMRKFPAGNTPSVSIPKFVAVRQAKLLEAVAIYDFMGPGMNLSGGGTAEQVKGVHVSQEYFRMLGVSPAMGRTFTADEDHPGGARVVVMTDGLWKRRFGADPGIIGRTIRLNSEPYEVVGVMAPSFSGEPASDLFIPAQADLNSTNQGNFMLLGARLKPGVTLAQANAELRVISDRFRKLYPGVMSPTENFSAVAMAPLTFFDVRTPLYILLGAVGFVLLIACANVANLLLARAAGRGREIAIRVAVGAGRLAILRQLLTEATLLAFCGGVAGVFLGAAGLRLLLTVAPADLPRLPSAENVNVFALMDARILAFALGVSVLTGILFGLVPALQTSRPDLNSTLRESGSRTTVGSMRQGTRNALVVAEIALSLVLLIGSALMIRTFLALRDVKPGFQTTSILTMSSSLAGKKYETAVAVERLANQVTRRIEALPGVQSATYALCLPLQLGPDMPFAVAGKRPSDGGPYLGDEQYRPVSAHYFQTLGIPLRRGRLFDERDSSTGAWTLIINEAMAKKYWPKENPVGAVVTIAKGLGPFDERPREVVGVVGDVREQALEQDPPAVMYVPIGQEPDGMIRLANGVLPSSWAVRTIGDPAAIARAAQQEVLRVDPDMPMARVITMDHVVAKSLARQRFSMILLGIFGAVALLLAAIGIYGVMSYTVEQRTNEIGVRMALGASTGQALRLVLGRGMLLAAIGVAIGLAASFGLMRLMASLLYGVKATDPLTFAGVAVVLAAVAALACYIPGRRAARVDPITALRYE